MRRQLGLVAAMEEDDVSIEVPPVVVEPPAEERVTEVAADTLESDLVEIADSTAEGESDEAQVVEAEEVSEALESMYQVMVVAVENGGLDKHSAQLANIAIEHLCSRVGIKKNKLPAMEAYSDHPSRIASTKLAMESIGETLKRIWLAIVEAVKKSIAWVKAHFTKLFDVASKLEARALGLTVSLEKLQDKAPAGLKIENEVLATGLYLNDSVTAYAMGAHEIEKMAPFVFDKLAGINRQLAEDTLKFMQEFDYKDMKNFDEKAPHPKYNPAGLHEVHYETVGTWITNKAYRSDKLPNNAAIIISVHQSMTEGEDKYDRGDRVKFGQWDVKLVEKTRTELPVLPKREMENIVQSVISFAKAAIAYKATLDSLSKIKDGICKAAEDLSKKSNEATDDVMKHVYPTQLTDVIRQIDQPAADFFTYGIKKGKMYLDYVELSMKQYS